MKHLITCTKLNVDYGRHQALRSVSLSLPPNTRIAILGPNGAGKSTLIKAIAGILSYRGKLSRNFHSCSYTAQRQEVNWDFPITCREVVEMGIYNRLGIFQRPSAAKQKQIGEALAVLDMADLADRPINELSVGQQQRIFLARAIADKEADLMLFDEPLTGVDVKTEKIIYQLFDKLIAEGKSIITVHHNLYDVAAHFDYGVLVNHSLIAHGPIKSVLSAANLNKAYGTGIAIPA